MPTATVRVRFFARYAELVGRDEVELTVSIPTTVGDVIRAVQAAHPGARELPDRPLVAVNLRHAKLDAAVRAGDEVALLPPLAGGSEGVSEPRA
ncbi:MAG TPA: MoaD/ThiS family protein [Gemmatimonadales bacterium]